ncbi:MAG: heat-inducible transcriptional repressor HrcA [Candidatus Eisenbacteria bacterium]
MQAAFSGNLTKVLDAVVTSYIGYGLPVGSRFVWVNFDMGLSPASIRNLMAELEGMGVLMKPHVSAGRIPTERGYRLYVDRVMKPQPLRRGETRAIRKAMDPSLPVGDMLERISRLLEALSHQICVTLTPERRSGVVTDLETVKISPDMLLITVTIEPGTERTTSLRFRSASALGAALKSFKRFSRATVGRSAEEAGRALENMDLSTQGHGSSVDKLRTSLVNLLRHGHHAVHVYGTGNVVSEMGDMTDVRSLLGVLERRQEIARLLLLDERRPGTSVIIGSENRGKPMKRCSVVKSEYRIGDAAGAIGVIGPLRMDYPRVMALVEYTSRELTQCLAEAGGRNKGGR